MNPDENSVDMSVTDAVMTDGASPVDEASEAAAVEYAETPDEDLVPAPVEEVVPAEEVGEAPVEAPTEVPPALEIGSTM